MHSTGLDTPRVRLSLLAFLGLRTRRGARAIRPCLFTSPSISHRDWPRNQCRSLPQSAQKQAARIDRSIRSTEEPGARADLTDQSPGASARRALPMTTFKHPSSCDPMQWFGQIRRIHQNQNQTKTRPIDSKPGTTGSLNRRRDGQTSLRPNPSFLAQDLKERERRGERAPMHFCCWRAEPERAPPESCPHIHNDTADAAHPPIPKALPCTTARRFERRPRGPAATAAGFEKRGWWVCFHSCRDRARDEMRPRPPYTPGGRRLFLECGLGLLRRRARGGRHPLAPGSIRRGRGVGLPAKGPAF